LPDIAVIFFNNLLLITPDLAALTAKSVNITQKIVVLKFLL
jgi:hypothetical protein